jgi:hypothetical protein
VEIGIKLKNNILFTTKKRYHKIFHTFKMNPDIENTLSPEQKYQELYSEMYRLCKENGWGDPFSYARSREIYMATKLGHRVGGTYSGADAYETIDGKEVPIEYKSTIGKHINGTYNGISVQETWEEQETYLREKKIACYRNHYFARFYEGKMIEVWKMSGETVLKLLLPKIHEQYHKDKKGKDPRLGATLTTNEIINNGKQVTL